MKGQSDRAVSVAWFTEKMAREGKRIKPLAEYLKPVKPPTPEQGAADLRGMIARMKSKQEKRDGPR